MSDFIEELKEHLKNTPKEELLKEWEKTKEFDSVGPSVDEYLNLIEEYKEKFICECGRPKEENEKRCIDCTLSKHLP